MMCLCPYFYSLQSEQERERACVCACAWELDRQRVCVLERVREREELIWCQGDLSFHEMSFASNQPTSDLSKQRQRQNSSNSCFSVSVEKRKMASISFGSRKSFVYLQQCFGSRESCDARLSRQTGVIWHEPETLGCFVELCSTTELWGSIKAWWLN